ncbi:MAG: chitobiase/beta-hexosaminidase C-terminal domain-containing protein [Muribaculaceae bacterium]|nr:chitobiase/beta-hexosaminidase C-terminal domain-containing protein [Muribaculaceae bacterium]
MKKFLLSLAAMAAIAPAYAGDGTKDNPYTVAEVRAMSADVASAYVKGYIVGCVDGKALESGAKFEAVSNVYSNVLIADSKDCKDVKSCVPVQLVSKTDIRSEVNLGDNPGNLGKNLLIEGQLTAYFGVMGVKTPTSATLSGEGSVVTPPEPAERVEVATVAEFLAVAPGTEVRFTSPVTAVYQYTTNLYVQDATGGMFIFGTTNQTYKPGDIIPAGFEGKYTDYNGCIEFEIPKNTDAKFAAATGTGSVEAAEWALEDLSVENQNQYVVVKNVSISATDDKNFVVTQDGTELSAYNKFGVSVATGDNLNIYGVMNVYSSKLQIYPIEITDASGSVVEAVAAPKFSVAAGAVEEGTSVEITCATEGASIYYTLDGTEPSAASTLYSAPIVINEAVIVKAIAIKEGLENSPVITVAYTIKADQPVGDGCFFNFEAPATLSPAYAAEPELGTKDGTNGYYYNVTDVAFTNGPVTVTATKGNSTDARLYYSNSAKMWSYRVYKGATMTISVSGDDAIVGLVAKGSYVTRLSSDDITWEGSGKEATWSGNALKTITFGNTEGTATINSLSVILSSGSAVEVVVEDGEEAPVEYFNLQGVRVAEPANGLFIRRQGNKVEKVVIR